MIFEGSTIYGYFEVGMLWATISYFPSEKLYIISLTDEEIEDSPVACSKNLESAKEKFILELSLSSIMDKKRRVLMRPKWSWN